MGWSNRERSMPYSVSSSRIDSEPSPEAVDALTKAIRPKIEDAGLKFQKIAPQYFDETQERQRTAFEYFQLTTERMVFSKDEVELLDDALREMQPIKLFTYLSNNIVKAESVTAGIPYSTITAVDFGMAPGWKDAEGRVITDLKDDEIVLNAWAAQDQGVTLGNQVQIEFFDPETTHGKTTEKQAEFTVRRIAPLVKPLIPYQRQEAAKYVDAQAWSNDPDMTPTVTGITDKDSIENWDAPFPFDYGRIQKRKPRDDDYWDNYRTTPKAFITLAKGQQLWGSRFGNVTSFRIEFQEGNQSTIIKSVESAIARDINAFGFQLLNVKLDGLKASKGTTPFNVLFFGFSFFIMAAAIMLVSILFRLGVEQRAGDTGLVLAVGLTRLQTAKLALLEGAIVGATGSMAGMLLGLAYAAAMIAGLRTRWLDAVSTPFLRLHVTTTSLVVGALIGIIVTVTTILWSLYRLRRVSLRNLLSGNMEDSAIVSRGPSRKLQIGIWVAFALAILSGLLGMMLSGEAQAGAFFGSGALVLMGLLTLVLRFLRKAVADPRFDRSNEFRLVDLVTRNTARNSGRSVLTIGLVSSACFLIIAISAFRLAPTEQGTAGFDLVATSEIPLLDNLADEGVLENVLGARCGNLTGNRRYPLAIQARRGRQLPKPVSNATTSIDRCDPRHDRAVQ